MRTKKEIEAMLVEIRKEIVVNYGKHKCNKLHGQRKALLWVLSNKEGEK